MKTPNNFDVMHTHPSRVLRALPRIRTMDRVFKDLRRGDSVQATVGAARGLQEEGQSQGETLRDQDLQ